MSKPYKVVSSLQIEEEYQSLLKANNVLCSYLPVAEIVIRNSKNIEHLIRDISSPMVFTSKYAVEFYLQNQGLFSNNLHQNKVYAIEGKTGKLLEQAGIKNLITAKDSEELGRIIITDCEKNVVYLTTEIRLPLLEKMLLDRNISCKAIVVYDKKHLDCAFHQQYDGLILSSPFMADGFLASNSTDFEKPVFCLGKTTANHLSAKGFKTIHVSDNSGQQSLVDCIIKYYNSKD